MAYSSKCVDRLLHRKPAVKTQAQKGEAITNTMNIVKDVESLSGRIKRNLICGAPFVQALLTIAHAFKNHWIRTAHRKEPEAIQIVREDSLGEVLTLYRHPAVFVEHIP